ncbi:transmembrane protein 205-like [Ptychodera flava]|uniref:transmembrane protein 205-like n=1 Tax=Ptychodera flava TaxID=63121 RepID=UPI00396A749F
MVFKYIKDNWPKYRFGQPAHALAVVVVLIGLFYFVQPLVSTNVVNFLHLLTFATYFGMQFWVTFIAGLTMFHNLPRHMFGSIQSKLFPKYFFIGSISSVVTMVTFLTVHPLGSMDNTQTKIQFGSLLTSILCTISNIIVTSIMINYMIERNVIEKKKGFENHVGHLDSKHFAGDAKYKELSSKFLWYHGISSVLNLVALCANMVYLYILSSKLNM